MRKTVAAALAAALAMAGPTQAATVGTGAGNVEIEVTVKARLVADEAAFGRGKHGHYVFVASAMADGVIEVEAVENVAGCTNVRPKFGRTDPTRPGFTRLAYAAYYGPYDTRADADAVKAAIAPCVGDAYVRAGTIQRF